MPGRGRAWLVMLLASPVIAGATEPVVQMEWYASSDPTTPITFNPADIGDSIPGDDGSTIYTGSLMGDHWEVAWTTRARNDATGDYLDAGLSIINLSSEAQSFYFDTRLNLPNDPGNAATVALAASLALTNMDFAGEASVMSFGSEPIVQATLGGFQAATIFDAPYELVAMGPFASAVDSDLTSEIPGIHPAETIGILTSFSLSPGDLLNITYVVDVSAIPVPGTLAVLALAVMGSRRRRRRDISLKWEANS
ncbi:MAG: hypothetical protein VX527_09140 [Planctomycetota bacterium]|nr:hypothetical protein [Planctomycetota bacterium]